MNRNHLFPSKAELERLRLRYPAGTRLQLIQMGEDPCPIPSGTMGTVQFVDDAGQIVMKWDNGRSLSLIPREDSFEKVSVPQRTAPKKGGDAR